MCRAALWAVRYIFFCLYTKLPGTRNFLFSKASKKGYRFHPGRLQYPETSSQNSYISRMKKLFILLLSFTSANLFCQVSISYNPQFSLEGIITDKKTKKPIENESFTVYAFGQAWDIYTGANGEYVVKFYEPGRDSPSNEKPGEEAIVFVYIDKRKFSIPTKTIEIPKEVQSGPPVVRRDVKL